MQIDIFNGLKAIEIQDNVQFSKNTLVGRIRIQKNVYLLSVLGYGPARKFEFTNYVHGPYSTSLADVYYSVGTERLKAAVPDRSIPPNVIKIIAEANSKGVSFLEALTTLISLRRFFGEPRIAVSNAKELKPYMKDELWTEAVEYVDTHPILWKN